MVSVHSAHETPIEKSTLQHDEETSSGSSDHKRNHVAGSVDEPTVTFKTWIVVAIMSLSYGLSFVPVPVMAAVGPYISADLGEPTGYVWYISAWILAITIGWMVAGANTDMLGRRWFIIMGSVICAIGHVVVGCAKNSNTIIAGMAVTGFGAALAQMATFALTELLPNKWRHIGVVLADGAVYITITLIPVTARYGYFVGDWRVNFYVAAAIQFLSIFGLFFFYYPPQHPLDIGFATAWKKIDYVGIFLFIAGGTPLLLGIVWASIYPSNSSHVVAPLVVGVVVLIVFACWESFAKIEFPLTPTRIFTRRSGRDFTAPCICIAIINMFYYSASIIWPTMIGAWYVADPSDWRRASILSLPQGLGVTTGGILLSLFGSKIRRWQHQLLAAVVVMVLFGSLMALGNKDNMGMMIAFLFLSLVGYGWAIYLCIAISQMGVEQEELGLSGGLSGCLRFAGGTIGQAVYTAIYTNTYTKYVAKLVPGAATGAGLSEADVPGLMKVVGTAALAKDFSPAVVLAVSDAVKEAVRHGVQLIAFASLAFGIVGIIAAAFCVDVDSKMTNEIEVFLENDKYADRNKHH